MHYIRYCSPVGDIIISSESGLAINGLWFMNQKHFPDISTWTQQESEIFRDATYWLDCYFEGKTAPMPAYELHGTPFQIKVWQELTRIPYGTTITYGQLAEEIGCRCNQAIGNAVGRNPLTIIVPCHRVIGADGTLTGYAGGLERKEWLLKHERNHIIIKG